jgi:hypothetical protein
VLVSRPSCPPFDPLSSSLTVRGYNPLFLSLVVQGYGPIFSRGLTALSLSSPSLFEPESPWAHYYTSHQCRKWDCAWQQQTEDEKKVFETPTNNCTGSEIQKPSRPCDVAQLGNHVVDPLSSLSACITACLGKSTQSLAPNRAK